MNNQNIIDIMCLFQVVSFLMVFMERKNIKNEWKEIDYSKKIGRVFFVFLPALVIISLIVNPL